MHAGKDQEFPESERFDLFQHCPSAVNGPVFPLAFITTGGQWSRTALSKVDFSPMSRAQPLPSSGGQRFGIRRRARPFLLFFKLAKKMRDLSAGARRLMLHSLLQRTQHRRDHNSSCRRIVTPRSPAAFTQPSELHLDATCCGLPNPSFLPDRREGVLDMSCRWRRPVCLQKCRMGS